MDIPVTYGAQTGVLTFEPDRQAWESHGKKNLEEYVLLDATGLPVPMNSVFVKRLAHRRADGHDLLLTCQKKPIRFTAVFLGYLEADKWNYYVYSKLPKIRELTEIFANRLVDQRKLIKRKLIVTILNNTFAVLEEINRRGFYYPDLCYLNIMYNPMREGVLLIDIDSCLPIHSSKQVNEMRVNKTWWALFHNASLSDLQYLNPTMLMSLTIILCQTLAKLETTTEKINLSGTILMARPEDQEALFQVFSRCDDVAFREMFATSSVYLGQIPFIFTSWKNLLAAMQGGQTVPWSLLRQFILRMLSLTGPEAWAHYIKDNTIVFSKILQSS